MKHTSKIIAAFAAFMMCTAAQAREFILVLELNSLTDGNVTDTVALYATQTDPNVASVDDEYRLTINGKPAEIPYDLLSDLNYARRGFSYDTFTGGIQSIEKKALCMLGGPAQGEILNVRYLTYDADSILESSQMRPVLSEAGNCLFAQIIRPNETEARINASKAMATLQTLREISRN